MSEQQEPFFPHRVDESIEHLSSIGRLSDAHPEQQHMDPNVRLVHDLQKMYAPEREGYLRALQRVEDRLVEQHIATSDQRGPTLVPAPPAQRRQTVHPRKLQRGRSVLMERKSSPASGKFGRPLSLMIAVLILVVLAGGLLVMQNALHQQTKTGAANQKATSTPASTSTPARTPTPIDSFGKTLYTTPPNRVGFNGLAWSPDSTRVASSTVEGVQIWDATTGKHLVNVPLSSTTGFPYGLAWSPNSQSLAVVTNQKLLIVDGKTGAILHTYSEPAASVNTATHDPYLATLMPASGGTGFRAVTWSPDGRSIAAAVSTGAQGHIQVLNAQTLTPAYTLQLSGNYVPGALAWSPDGQYLAAGVFNTQPGGQTVPPEQEAMIWAWNLSTHQLVFQKPGDSPAFQPKTHNLAFLLSRNGSSSLEIWDLASGKQLKHYQNHQITGSGTLAWSPDGRHLAYAEGTYGIDSGSTVTIMDIDNGRSIYTYMGHHLYISQLAWSPNGKYIVSAEGQTSGPMVAKVWTAG